MCLLGSIYSTVVSEIKLTPYIHMVWNDVVFRLCACWGVFIVQWCQKLSWHPIYTWCEMTLFSGFVPAGSIYSIVMSEVKLTPYIHMVWNDVVFRLCACWGVFIVQWCQKLSWHPIYTWCEMTLFSGFVPAGSIYSIVMSEVKLTPYIHMVWNDVVFRLCACWGVFTA